MTQQYDGEIVDDNDVLGFFDRLDVSPQETDNVWVEKYTSFTFHNPVRKWKFLTEDWGGSEIETDNEEVDIEHKDKDLPGFLLESVSLVMINWRMIWEFENPDGRMIYTQQKEKGDTTKWTSRWNFLVMLKEKKNFTPAIITMRGYIGGYFYDNVCQARNRNKSYLGRIGKKGANPDLFWITMIGGPRKMVGPKGQQSAIFPPVAPVPAGVTENTTATARYMFDMYIGEEGESALRDWLYAEGERWSKEHGSLQATNGPPQIGPSGGVNMTAQGGIIEFPNLTDATQSEWVDCAMTIPDLFANRDDAQGEFKSLAKRVGFQRKTTQNQWEAWKSYLQDEVDKKYIEAEEVNRELQNRQ